MRLLVRAFALFCSSYFLNLVRWNCVEAARKTSFHWVLCRRAQCGYIKKTLNTGFYSEAAFKSLLRLTLWNWANKQIKKDKNKKRKGEWGSGNYNWFVDQAPCLCHAVQCDLTRLSKCGFGFALPRRLTASCWGGLKLQGHPVTYLFRHQSAHSCIYQWANAIYIYFNFTPWCLIYNFPRAIFFYSDWQDFLFFIRPFINPLPELCI